MATEAILATLGIALLLMLLSGSSMGAGMGLAGFALVYVF